MSPSNQDLMVVFGVDGFNFDAMICEQIAHDFMLESLDYIGTHIDENLDDEVTESLLKSCGATSPEIRRVVDKHHDQVRINTLQRIKKSASTSNIVKARKYKQDRPSW